MSDNRMLAERPVVILNKLDVHVHIAVIVLHPGNATDVAKKGSRP